MLKAAWRKSLGPESGGKTRFFQGRFQDWQSGPPENAAQLFAPLLKADPQQARQCFGLFWPLRGG